MKFNTSLQYLTILFSCFGARICASVRVRQLRSLARRGLACFFLVDYTQKDGRSSSLSLSLSLSLYRESVGLFRLMNLGVSGESGLASKQIRGKIPVRRGKEGRRTDCHLEKIYGRTIAAQKPFCSIPRKREGGREEGGIN